MKSFAQNMEDVLLQRIFKDKKDGFYIDIGAHDPVELSVTKIFYDMGWSGINIEPLTEKIEVFKLARPRDINLGIAIADNPGQAMFYAVMGQLRSKCDASALSSFSLETVREAQDMLGVCYKTILVSTDTLTNICQKHVPDGKHIDFLKIDTEGYELTVLQSADFVRFRPTVLIIEVAPPNSHTLNRLREGEQIHAEELDAFLHVRNYSPVYDDGINRFYLAGEAAALRPLFSIPVGIFDDINIPFFWREISKLKKRVRDLEAALKEHTAAAVLQKDCEGK